ncbi:hypothetical protein TRSC58_07486 [Trypanosoma rangeli SC58]|uniref:Uncharacterized protein n=1 Tax=Trypanosoma rangeli SC58 TaxID=429131 RepID=A0A061IRX9_TRYRA|nr:hypothetical protein TRSC58_07486 [Trypanosoma rangeli SC58]
MRPQGTTAFFLLAVLSVFSLVFFFHATPQAHRKGRRHRREGRVSLSSIFFFLKGLKEEGKPLVYIYIFCLLER